MAFGDTPYDKPLKQAWDNFCDELKAAPDLVFRDTMPITALDRATGFQYLARYITKAFQDRLEFNDTLFPQLWQMQTPTNKCFGDNPDCNYLTAYLDGAHKYRISGIRGTSQWVSFCAHEGAYGPLAGALNNAKIDVSPGGYFEIILSAEEHQGNWLKLAPGLNWLFIREYFGAWDTEIPMDIRLERIGGTGAPPVLTPERMIRALEEAGPWLIEDSRRWVERYPESYAKGTPNQFVVRNQAYSGGDGAEKATGRMVNFCYWEVQPDEALIIEVKPPKAAFWNFELANFYFISMDYRYRLSSLNGVQAAYQDDGSVVSVLSHMDPGIHNWLDTSGHCNGMMNQRWVDAEDRPLARTKLVKMADLEKHLPADVKRVTLAEREEQRRRRKRGVDQRFKL